MNSQYLDSLNAPLQLQPSITAKNAERIIKRLIENGKQVKTAIVNQDLVYRQWVLSVDEHLKQLFVNNSTYNAMFLRIYSLLKPCIQQPKSMFDNNPYANPYSVKPVSTTPQNQFITIDNCIDDAIEAIEEMALGIDVDLNPKVTAVEDNKPQQAQGVKSDNPKIFISHASKDEKIISSFVEKIFRLGCGLQPKDIVYTSDECMGIKTGEDIRNYLKNNLKDCEYVFFMISENYQKSGICLNEMGAAWVLDKKVKPFLFPNLNFTDLGWLYEISKGSTLDNDSALDHLHDELLSRYALVPDQSTAEWNKQKDAFLEMLKTECPNQPDIEKLCPAICPISSHKNILSPTFDFFKSGDSERYSLYLAASGYDIIVKFNANNRNWAYSINIRGWIASDLENNSRTFRLRKGEEGYLDFRFTDTGSAEIILETDGFSENKPITWK